MSRREKHGGRVSDEELFTRLLYYGMAHLSLRMEEVWLMPFGLLMDLVGMPQAVFGACGSQNGN